MESALTSSPLGAKPTETTALIFTLAISIAAVVLVSSLNGGIASALSRSSGTTAPSSGLTVGTDPPPTVVISSSEALSRDLIATSVTINSGVTLTTEGFSIIVTGTFDNLGTVQTGNAATTNFPNSEGGSGGGAQSQNYCSYAQNGYSTAAPGGNASCSNSVNGISGSTPAAPSLTSTLVNSWYYVGMTNYLSGAAGGAISGYSLPGGSGASGVYIQADTLIAGTIEAVGQDGTGTGSGIGLAGGGGGGVVLLAYGSGGLTAGAYNVEGGSGAASYGGNVYSGSGGPGQVLAFAYGSAPPVQPSAGPAGQPPLEDDSGFAYCDGSCGSNSLTAADTTGAVAEGDIIVAALTTYGEETPTLEAANLSDSYGGSPWTMLGSPISWDGTSTDYTYVFLSSPTTIAGSGSVSVTFVGDSTTDASFVWYSFSGVNTASPIEAWNTATSSTPGTSPSASVTTVNPNDVVLGFVGDSSVVGAQPTVATPGFAGYDFTSTDVNTYVEYEQVSSAGTQTSSPTLNSASNYAIWVLALQGQGADLSPDSGFPDYTNVGVSGHGYTPDASITVSFGGSDVETCSADASGDLSDCAFLVPQVYPGVYPVVVTDGTHTAYSPFTVEGGCAGSIGEIAGEPVFIMPLGANETYDWYIFGYAACPEVVAIQLPAFSGTDPPTMTAFPSIFTLSSGYPQLVQLNVSMPNDLTDADQGWTRIAGASEVVSCGGGACIEPGVAKICQVVVPVPTFSEIGLPSGQTWSVTFNGVTNSLTTDGGTDTLYFAYEYPGNYAYSIADNPGYYQDTIPYSGTEIVSGADIGLVVTYAVSAAIAVTPSQGPVGATYTVTGSGFSVSSGATVAFNGVDQTPTGGSDCSFAGTTITTDGSGGFVCTFAVPSATPGSYQVTGADLTTSTETSPQTFTVIPVVAVIPDRGPSGATYTVTGSGFSDSSGATVSFGGNLQAPTGGSDCSFSGTTITTDSSGGFVCTFTVPSESAGPYSVVGEDTATSLSTAARLFSVTKPALSLSPRQGPSAAFVAASGTGFTPGATITISISAGATLGSEGSCVATPSGKFGGRGCSFTVSGSPGRYTLTATGGDGGFDSATASFTVTKPAISVSPGQGPVGTAATVSGTGFSVSSTVGLVFDGVTISSCTSGSLTTSEKGRFSCSFSVPGGASGKTVIATDVGGTTATGKFTVTTPKIRVSPARGPVGATVIVSGRGFSVSSTVGLVFDGVMISSCASGSLTTSASGSFSCSLTVPTGTTGSMVVATDIGGQTAMAKFTVT